MSVLGSSDFFGYLTMLEMKLLTTDHFFICNDLIDFRSNQLFFRYRECFKSDRSFEILEVV